jgi:hypothetical protein
LLAPVLQGNPVCLATQLSQVYHMQSICQMTCFVHQGKFLKLRVLGCTKNPKSTLGERAGDAVTCSSVGCMSLRVKRQGRTCVDDACNSLVGCDGVKQDYEMDAIVPCRQRN